jgi:hypothetical protein
MSKPETSAESPDHGHASEPEHPAFNVVLAVSIPLLFAAGMYSAAITPREEKKEATHEHAPPPATAQHGEAPPHAATPEHGQPAHEGSDKAVDEKANPAASSEANDPFHERK